MDDYNIIILMEESKNTVIRQSGGVGAVIIFFILLFAFAKWGPSVPFSVLSQSKGEPMVVTGEGKTTAVPDIAKVSAGIQDSGPNLATVQNSVNRSSKSLVNALKELGIEEKDIKTNSYNIYPQQDYQARPPIITGYQVSINYIITVRDIDKINDVLTKLPASGANLVGGVTFDLSDEARDKALNEARTDAVKTAKNNAESLAKASGVTLGRIINISESQGNLPRPMYSLDSKSAVGLGGGPTQPDVQPGTTEVDITVTLSYEVR